MELPENQVGPTDVIAYRECPRRMSFGMRRHTGKGEQDQQATMPEADQHGSVWARKYGSAIHVALAQLEAGFTPERAIQDAWNEHGHHLDPADLDLLSDDIAVYLGRNFPNTRTVLNEHELRVFLMEFRGRRIFVRTRVDRLLESLDEPGHFIHIDYKSSRHPKTDADVRDDLQLWITNWALHEYMPEIDSLKQYYDQLRFGQIPTSKTEAARKRIKQFLITQVTAILEDEGVKDDGLLAPKKNQWCAYCPILESCPIVDVVLDFAKVEINLLAPSVKQGRKTVVQLDEGLIDEYLQRFEDAKEAGKIIERFVDAVGGILKAMPPAERERLGYKATTRNNNVFSPLAKKAIVERMGEDRFLLVSSLSKSRLEAELADEPEMLEWALGLAEKQAGSTILVRT